MFRVVLLIVFGLFSSEFLLADKAIYQCDIEENLESYKFLSQEKDFDKLKICMNNGKKYFYGLTNIKYSQSGVCLYSEIGLNFKNGFMEINGIENNFIAKRILDECPKYGNKKYIRMPKKNYKDNVNLYLQVYSLISKAGSSKEKFDLAFEGTPFYRKWFSGYSQFKKKLIDFSREREPLLSLKHISLESVVGEEVTIYIYLGFNEENWRLSVRKHDGFFHFIEAVKVFD